MSKLKYIDEVYSIKYLKKWWDVILTFGTDRSLICTEVKHHRGCLSHDDHSELFEYLKRKVLRDGKKWDGLHPRTHPKMVDCPACNGSGWILNTAFKSETRMNCSACQGIGRVKKSDLENIKKKVASRKKRRTKKPGNKD